VGSSPPHGLGVPAPHRNRHARAVAATASASSGSAKGGEDRSLNSAEIGTSALLNQELCEYPAKDDLTA
jgi:hypothetical protein